VRLALALAAALALASTTAACPHAGQIALQTGQCVLDTGVLGVVLVDLTSANYAQLIADAVTKFTPALVTCALQAVAASEQPPAGSGAGSGVAMRATFDPVIVTRAKEMLAKYGAHQ